MIPKQTPKSTSIFQKEIIIGGVSVLEISLFTKHLALTLRSGISLAEGLRILSVQSKGRMRQITNDLLRKIEGGSDFHTALEHHEKYFGPIYINMIKIGEESGTLDMKLEKLAEQMKKAHLLKKKVQSAMLYPSMVFIAIVGLGLSIALFVLPQILPLFKSLDVELPFTTQILIKVADITSVHGDIIMVGVLIFMTLFFWIIKRKFMHPIVHKIILVIPVVKNIVKNMNLEKFTYMLGTLLDSGIPIHKALEITAQSTGNFWYRRAITRTSKNILGGKTLAEGLEQTPSLFPPITTKMVAMGEETGHLANSLQYLSEFYEDEVNEVMKNLSNILEPVLLIFIGLIVGGVALSILGPIYEITGSLNT